EQRLLGKPMVESQGPDGTRMVPNNAYWEAMYKLLRCNVELARQNTPNTSQLVDDTRLKLKQLYITWPEPGGARWSAQFDSLRRELLPAWSPPVLSEDSAASPATAPATAPAAVRK